MSESKRLIENIRCNDKGRVSKTLEEEVLTQEEYDNGILLACEEGHVDIVSFLIKYVHFR